jgi:Protein of unknown function (DUF3667)
MSHHKFHHPSCLNCHYPLAEFDQFCPNCGQKPMSPKSSMHDLLHEFFHTFWHLDGKFFMTLHHLVIPGKLTTEFFKGHLKRYAHPIQLFLVLGAFAFGTLASKARKAEEAAQAKVETRRDEYRRKAFLQELDSIRKNLMPPQYSDAKTQLLSDSLMFKMKFPQNLEIDREKIQQEVNDALDEAFTKRHKSKVNKFSVRIGKDSAKVNYSITDEPDSLHAVREAFKDSMIDALVNLSDNSMSERVLKTADSLEKRNKKEEGDLSDFSEGFKEGWNNSENERLLAKLRPKIEEIKRKRGLKEAIELHEDTNNISVMGEQLRIPSREMYELTPDEIIEKYKVKGFWLKLLTKQGIKATQDSGNLIHFFMGKLFWATVAVIPLLALFFSLVYWRRKRYYVEHIVFLIHFNTAAFLILIPILWISEYNDTIIPLYFMWFCIHFIASLKFYYQQSWLKTLLKSFIIGIAYSFIATFAITIGAIIGLALF